MINQVEFDHISPFVRDNSDGIFWSVGLAGFLIGCLIWGFICKAIVSGKGYSDEDNKGFFGGFFLGIIGLIVCASKPSVINVQSYQDKINQKIYHREPVNTSWVCNCGARNSINEETCQRCGRLKMSIDVPKAKNIPAPRPITAVQTTVRQTPIANNDLKSIKEEIVQLKAMLDEGLITEEEFAAKKKKILEI